jgi:hypothetical protein
MARGRGPSLLGHGAEATQESCDVADVRAFTHRGSQWHQEYIDRRRRACAAASARLLKQLQLGPLRALVCSRPLRFASA